MSILHSARGLLVGAVLATLVPAHAQMGERPVKFILPVATASGGHDHARAQPAPSSAGGTRRRESAGRRRHCRHVGAR
jgi:hypothetical protein